MPKYKVTFHYEREFDLVVEADSREDARVGVEEVFEFYKLDYILDNHQEIGIDSIEELDYVDNSHVEYVFEKEDDEEETEG